MRLSSSLGVPVACGVAVLGLSATLSRHGFAQEASATRDPGIYMASAKQTPPQYVAVHPHYGSPQMNTGKTVLTMGLAGVETKVDISGSKADERVSTGDLVFIFQMNLPAAPPKGQPPPDINATMAQAAKDREMPLGLKNPDGFSLVRSTVDGDARHLNLGSQGGKTILGGNRRAKDAVDFSVEKLGADQFRVKPKSPLSPGEYAFVLTQGQDGRVWDFGVDGQ